MDFRLLCFSFFVFFSSVSSQKVRYDDYQLYRITPRTAEEIELLNLAKNFNSELRVWIEPRRINSPVLVMVPPNIRAEFINFVQSNRLDATMTISNVQKFIESQGSPAEKMAKSMNWDDYYPLDTIYLWLDELAAKHSNVKTVVAGKTYEGREIKGIEITNGENLPGVVFESGIHAREWIAPAASSWIINEALNSPDDSIWRQFNFLYFPSVNPDGYEYTYDGDRMWRKTRRPYLGGLCVGADMNRNWDNHWMEGGSDSNPCSEAYAGPEPLSEIETKSLSEYLTEVSSKHDIYISFHSFSQLLMFPWGYTSQHAPLHNLWKRVGDAAAADLKAVHGKEFTVGNIHDTIYPASGSSIEWYYGAFNSTLTFTFECRDTGSYGFLLPKEQIIPSGEELQAAIQRMLVEYTKLKHS